MLLNGCKRLKLNFETEKFEVSGRVIGRKIHFFLIASYVYSEDIGIIGSVVYDRITNILPLQEKNYLKVLRTGVYVAHTPIKEGLTRYTRKLLHGFVKVGVDWEEVYFIAQGSNYKICTAEWKEYYLTPSFNFFGTIKYSSITDTIVDDVTTKYVPSINKNQSEVLNAIKKHNAQLLEIPINYVVVNV